MRRLVFLFIILSGGVFFAISCAGRDDVPVSPARIYYVDSGINMLLPYETELVEASAQYRAQSLIDKLIEGQDDNDKIRRIIPKEKGCITCRVDGMTAYVDVKSSIRKKLTDSRDIERLFIYQITDTLTSVKGIRYVRFTVDGEVHKNFMGYYDMRETYTFSYPE